jgi:hypothetical protein
VTTDALFLKDPRSIAGSTHSVPEKALSLAKLAFFAISQGYLEHALWALREAERHGWRELDLAEPWFRFLLDFFELAEGFPKLMPETFSERHAQTAMGCAEFARRATEQVDKLRLSLEGMRALLLDHHFGEAAEAMLRQTDIDQKRLGLPPLSTATCV